MYEYRGFVMCERMQEALDRYASHHEPVGNFLTSVLENNLSLAVGYADSANLANLPAFVGYLYNEMPSPCWGSKEKVKAWLAQKA